MIAETLLWLALLTNVPLEPAAVGLLPRLTPMAERMGMADRGRALTDASFRLAHPDDYHALVAALPGDEHDHEALATVASSLAGIVAEQPAEITQRRKSVYSTWAKMQRKEVGLDQIFDRLATRVVLPDEADCYAVLDQLHQRFAHDPEELDDYIASPKASGYQSLHTVVHVPTTYGVSPVEVQLRTLAMHEAAEHGDAAHWRYKLA